MNSLTALFQCIIIGCLRHCDVSLLLNFTAYHHYAEVVFVEISHQLDELHWVAVKQFVDYVHQLEKQYACCFRICSGHFYNLTGYILWL